VGYKKSRFGTSAADGLAVMRRTAPTGEPLDELAASRMADQPNCKAWALECLELLGSVLI
jgi:hypothetical protein